MSVASDKMRRLASLGDEKRDRGLTTPAYVKRYDDIQYGPDPDWNVLDVYRNRYWTGKKPVILIVHGGGWVYGSKEVYQYYGMDFVRRGFAVVNYSYRLAPEHKYPSSLEDTLLVADFVMKNAEKYGFDTDNLFAVGDSAGGSLLGMLCDYLADPDYRESVRAYKKKLDGSDMPPVPDGFSLQAIGMNCGAYHLFDENGKTDRDQDQELMRDLFTHGADPEEQKLVNITDHIGASFPPAYIMTAQGDFLNAQAPVLLEACKKAGVEAEMHIYGTEEDPLYHVFHVTVQSEEGRRCNDEECVFFRKHMAG